MTDRLLKPRKKQTNSWMRGFICAKPNSEADILETQRILRIIDNRCKLIKQKRG